MIDMVFLLLIFFLVAAIVVDTKVKVTVPTAVQAVVPPDITGRVLISVEKDGTYYFGLKKMTLDEIKEALKKELDLNEKVRVQIRADGDVRYKVNEDLMAACAAVGALDLIYSAYEMEK
jgi:biopolymer transport protein ExbD